MLKFIFMMLAAATMIRQCPLPEPDSDIVLRPDKTGSAMLQLFDQERNKQITVEVWYPVDPAARAQTVKGYWKRAKASTNSPVASDNRPLPLILLSHGYGGNPGSIAWLGEILAANGFIAAAPQHDDFERGTGKVHINHWNRPLDISEVIDGVMHSRFGPVIDEERIGIAGFSLGGTTALWIAGARAFDYEKIEPTPEHAPKNRFLGVKNAADGVDYERAKGEFRDTRVKSAFVMAPAWGWVFPARGLNLVEVPLTVIVGENDEVIVPKTNAAHFAENIPNSCMTLLPGKVGHYVFLGEIKPDVMDRFDPERRYRELYADDPSVERRAVHEMVGQMAVEFFRRTLGDDDGNDHDS